MLTVPDYYRRDKHDKMWLWSQRHFFVLQFKKKHVSNAAGFHSSSAEYFDSLYALSVGISPRCVFAVFPAHVLLSGGKKKKT